MGDGKRFDQALRALEKLIAEQQRSEQAAQLLPATATVAAPVARHA